MKILTIIGSVVLLGSGILSVRAQDVTLGDAIFGPSSDQIPADWYHPMTIGTNTLDGYGDNVGSTMTETFSLGETLSGVKCIKRQVVVSSPDGADVTEDWWLAIDTSGDIRVLKSSGTTLASFTATETIPAPLFLPGDPADDQTWELFGRTLTVESVIESGHFACLVIKSEASGTESRTSTFSVGVGLTSEMTGTSGWNGQLPPPLALAVPESEAPGE